MKPTPEAGIKEINRAIVLRPLSVATDAARDGEARHGEARDLCECLVNVQSCGEKAPSLGQEFARYLPPLSVVDIDIDSYPARAGAISLSAQLIVLGERDSPAQVPPVGPVRREEPVVEALLEAPLRQGRGGADERPVGGMDERDGRAFPIPSRAARLTPSAQPP